MRLEKEVSRDKGLSYFLLLLSTIKNTCLVNCPTYRGTLSIPKYS
nr:MAG TPA: hypothetical protein [Caudoviricetes sp.]